MEQERRPSLSAGRCDEIIGLIDAVLQDSASGHGTPHDARALEDHSDDRTVFVRPYGGGMADDARPRERTWGRAAGVSFAHAYYRDQEVP